MKTTSLSLMIVSAMIGLNGVCRAQVFSTIYNDGRPNPVTLAEGKVYGTTQDGACFSMNPDGTVFRVLYSFGASDASQAKVLFFNGTLYGTTASGGANRRGCLFSIGTNGSSYTALRDFDAGTWAGNYLTNNDGAFSSSPLIASGSSLYGSAPVGGHFSFGTVFSILTNGTGFTVLHHFAGGLDGVRPSAGLLELGTRLYGVTRYGGSSGCGVIFSLNKDGSDFSITYDFPTAHYDNSSKLTNQFGVNPTASLITDGTFIYGLAYSGGSFGNGTVFKLKPDGTEFSVIKHFSANFDAGGGQGTNPDGASPNALLLHGGWLYGTAYSGGTEGFGTLFAVRPDGSEFYVLHHFDPVTSTYCIAPGLEASGTTLFGASQCGGTLSRGTVFTLDLVPRFLSVSAVPGAFSLTCNLIPGRQHAIQYSTDPVSSDWLNLTEFFSATNSLFETTDSLGSDTQRFYRIQMVP